MIRTDNGETSIICDFCPYDEQYDGDFMEVVSQAKEDDWKIFQVEGEWTHKCPSCVEDD